MDKILIVLGMGMTLLGIGFTVLTIKFLEFKKDVEREFEFYSRTRGEMFHRLNTIERKMSELPEMKKRKLIMELRKISRNKKQIDMEYQEIVNDLEKLDD